VCSAVAGATDYLENLEWAWLKKNRSDITSILKKLKNRFESLCYELMKGHSSFTICYAKLNDTFEKMEARLNFQYNVSDGKWLMAQGEFLTSFLISQYLAAQTIHNILLDAFDFMSKDADGKPSRDHIKQKICALPHYSGRGIYVTQGYICLSHQGLPDNLGRGGSDYTATLLGAALNVSIVEIWTDIDGLHNNDPRYVDHTYPVDRLSYNEASELAYFGAKILHPLCVQPVAEKNIPMLLKCTMQPQKDGTFIHSSAEGVVIKAIAAKDNITIIRIKSADMFNAYGFLSRIFKVFEQYQTSIDVITTSEVAVAVTIDNNSYIEDIVNDLQEMAYVEVIPLQTILCVVGDALKISQKQTAVVLDALQGIKLNMISYGGSKNNLSIVVPLSQKKEALQRLQKKMFTKNKRFFSLLHKN